MAAVIEALTVVAGVELAGCSSSAAQLLDRVRGLGRVLTMAAAELARAIAHAEASEAAPADGLTGMRAWTRGHLHVSGVDAAALLAQGRLCARMPVLGAATAAGAVHPGQLRMIGSVLTDRVWEAGEVAGVDLAAVDALITDTAAGPEARTLPVVCRRIADALDPDGPEPGDPTEGRSLRITRRADGSRIVRGSLDAAGGEKVEVALEAIAAAGRCEGDLRTGQQRTADALVQLADLHLAAGDLPVLRKVKPHLTALVQLPDLLDPTVVEAAVKLGSGAVVPNLVARAAACDADIARIVLGPDGLPLNVGRGHRLVPAHIRRSAEVRDGGCVFAGCQAPAWWCDAHHLVHWIDGGATSLENTALLCERHHTQVHHGFSIEWDDGERRWRTFRPGGREILLGPIGARAPDPPLFDRSG